MTTLSFNPRNTVVSENTEVKEDNKPTTAARLATPGQIKCYYDVCARKEITPVSIPTTMSFDQMDKMIKEVIAFHPASKAQLQKIQEKIDALAEYNITVQFPTAPLTGGREGTASALINKLVEMENEEKKKAPPTDKQLQWLVHMYLCPDVAFEEVNISRMVDLDEFCEVSGKPFRRYMEPDEFAQEIIAKMNSGEATQFLNKFKNVHYEWKITRASEDKINLIKTLQDRIAGTTPIMKAEWVVDKDGVLQMIKTPAFPQQKEITPGGFTPLKELQLLQLSSDEADKLIEMLQAECARKESTPTEGVRDDKELRPNQDDELDKLTDLMYKLEAVAGYEDPELHEAVSSLMTEGYEVEEVQKSKTKIKEFMLHLFDEKAIDFDGLISLCSDSSTAQNILITG